MMDEDMLLLAALEEEDELLLHGMLAGDRANPIENRVMWRFNFDALEDQKCFEMFRFEKRDVIRLKNAFGFPEDFICYNRTRVSGLEAICILLRRLAYPNRLVDLIQTFGRRKEELSIIFNKTLSYIYDNFGHLVRNLDHPWLAPNYLKIYGDAVHEKGAPLTKCWGFIDGTARPISRPSIHQQEVYSGHKRAHVLKFQSIQVPNGLIAHMFGPVEGRRHDAAMLAESGILPAMEALVDDDGEPFYVYGDPAYPLRPQLISPFRGANLTDQEAEFNQNMSKVRQCVEWGFGDIIRQFAFLDFKKNLKLFLQPVGKYYLIATILTNCRACLYGNEVSQYFGIAPPVLEEYLNNLP